MKPYNLLKQGITISAIALTFGASANASEKLQVQALFNPSDRVYQHVEQCFKSIQKASGEEVELELLPVGAVVGPSGTLEAIKMGVLDGHFTYSPLWAGIDKSFPLIADLPGGHDDEESVYEFFYKGEGMSLIRRAYDRFGAYTAGIVPAGIEAMPSLKPLRNIDDLKGKKIRMPTGLSAIVMERLGASPVTLPMSDAYGALEKGVVDAADFGALWWNDDIGIHQFAKYEWYPAMHSNIALDLSFNKKKWNSLSDAAKTAIEEGIKECGEGYMDLLKSAHEEAMAKMSDKGVEVIAWSDEDRNKFRAVSRQVWEEAAEQGSELAKEALQANVEHLVKRGVLQQ